MKKIFMVLSACLVAGLMIVSCGKDNKDNGKKTDDQEGQEQEEDEFVPLIAVDGQFADWADITGYEGEEGSYVAFKAAMDEQFLYFYAKRTSARMDELWGGNGYFYFGLDLDSDPETGDAELWGNAGGYELLIVLFPFAGTVANEEAGTELAPAFGLSEEGTVAPDNYTVANAKANGAYDENGVEVEFSIPLEDLPEIKPNTPLIITTWGNKGSNKIVYKCSGL